MSALPRDKAIARILELTGRPQAKSKEPWLVLTVGLPGSGKSTFARKLARATRAVVLESDALRSALFERPTHESEESKQLFEALYAAAAQLLHAGQTVIVDATNLKERDRHPAYEVAKAMGAGLLVLHFRASEAVTAERLTSRSRGFDPDDRSTADMSVYMKMAELEEPLLREHWRIDTSDAADTDAALDRAIESLTGHSHRAEGPHRGGSIS